MSAESLRARLEAGRWGEFASTGPDASTFRTAYFGSQQIAHLHKAGGCDPQQWWALKQLILRAPTDLRLALDVIEDGRSFHDQFCPCDEKAPCDFRVALDAFEAAP